MLPRTSTHAGWRHVKRACEVVHADELRTPARAGVAYLNYVSLLNQVIMMGTQIYHDACDTQHHKYVAHQLALLYVSRC